MIANPHWPLYAVPALGQNASYEVLPKQHGHALLRSRDAINCSGFGPLNVSAQDAR